MLMPPAAIRHFAMMSFSDAMPAFAFATAASALFRHAAVSLRQRQRYDDADIDTH